LIRYALSGAMTPMAEQSIGDRIKEVWDMVVAYAKQETIDPLRTIGRYVAYGIGGMAVITLGVVLLGFSLLRGLQEIDAFDGFWKWVPYLILVIVFGGLTAIAFKQISRPSGAKKAAPK